MVSIIASSAENRGFEPRRVKPKTIKFSAKHVALRRKCKDCLARNPDNVVSVS